MNLVHLLSQDKETKTATLLLYGEIGSKIDGDILAQEIQYLDKDNDEIVLRINSAGGSVIQGLSIFNAILNTKAHVTVHIDGIAASMAGVIPMAADKVIMNDFARIMLHAPFFKGNQTGKMSKKEQKSVEAARGILASLLQKRGLAADTVAKYIDEETWFDADEALAAGLVDEIATTGKKHEVEQVIAGIAALAPSNFEPYLYTNPQNKMKEVTATLLGLDATSATEAQVIAEIKAVQQERDAAKANVTTLTAKVNELQQIVSQQQEAEIADLVNQAISGGHFEEALRDNLTTMAKNDLPGFRTMVKGLKPISASLAADLQAAAAAAAAGEKKDFEWWRRNDPRGLEEMKNSSPAAFEKLYNAWQEENK